MGGSFGQGLLCCPCPSTVLGLRSGALGLPVPPVVTRESFQARELPRGPCRVVQGTPERKITLKEEASQARRLTFPSCDLYIQATQILRQITAFYIHRPFLPVSNPPLH